MVGSKLEAPNETVRLTNALENHKSSLRDKRGSDMWAIAVFWSKILKTEESPDFIGQDTG